MALTLIIITFFFQSITLKNNNLLLSMKTHEKKTEGIGKTQIIQIQTTETMNKVNGNIKDRVTVETMISQKV